MFLCSLYNDTSRMSTSLPHSQPGCFIPFLKFTSSRFDLHDPRGLSVLHGSMESTRADFVQETPRIPCFIFNDYRSFWAGRRRESLSQHGFHCTTQRDPSLLVLVFTSTPSPDLIP